MTNKENVINLLLIDHNSYLDDNMEYAINSFTKTGDYQMLHMRIIHNDTVVRESFYNTLCYIETNDLVPEYMFACI